MTFQVPIFLEEPRLGGAGVVGSGEAGAGEEGTLGTVSKLTWQAGAAVEELALQRPSLHQSLAALSSQARQPARIPRVL